MINLNVAAYCQNCPEFEAHVEKEHVEVLQFNFTGDDAINTTTITCKHAKRCEAIRKHLLRNWEVRESTGGESYENYPLL